MPCSNTAQTSDQRPAASKATKQPPAPAAWKNNHHSAAWKAKGVLLSKIYTHWSKEKLNEVLKNDLWPRNPVTPRGTPDSASRIEKRHNWPKPLLVQLSILAYLTRDDPAEAHAVLAENVRWRHHSAATLRWPARAAKGIVYEDVELACRKIRERN